MQANPLITSTIEDIVAHQDVLWTKFTYNIQQLSTNNAKLSQLLFEATVRERDNIKEEIEYGTKIINACRQLQDSFITLDVLEKKTTLLKAQTEEILKKLDKEKEELMQKE